MLFAQVLLQVALCAGPQLTWESHTNHNDITGMCADTSGVVLCGASRGGVFTFSTGDTSLLRSITNTDGLPFIEATVAAVGLDDRAWIGTRGGGICAIDLRTGTIGTIVDRNNGLISDTVLAVLFVHDSVTGDRVIAGMPGGLSIIDPASGDIVRNFYPQQGYPLGTAVQALALRRDTLWIGTDARVAYAPFDSINNPAGWNTATTGNTISLFAADTMIIAGLSNGAVRGEAGSAWPAFPSLSSAVRAAILLGDSVFFATSSGVVRYHAGIMANRTGSGLPSTNVTGLIKDRQNRLWAGTAKGLALFQGASWRAFRFNGLGGNNCNYVAVETDGTPWVSHLTAGVSRRLDGAWQTFNQGSNGDTINNVTTIGCDPNGDVWLGTWGYGVTRRTREGSWRHYGSPPLPTPVVNVILPARSNGIYFSHWSNDYNDLLSRWDYADSTWHVIWGPNYDFRPLCLAFGDDGKLWVGTYGKPNYNGVYRQALDGKWDNWTTMNSGLPSNKVNALAIDNGGWVWAGTDNGLARYAGAAFLPVPNPDLGSKITAITVDRENNKWIGTDRGLFLLTWDGWWFVYNQRDAYGTGSRLLSDNVSFIAAAPRDASGDDIYVATDRGLNIIRCRASGDQSADQPVVAPNPLTMASGTPVMLSRLPDRAAVRVYTLDGRLIASATGPAAPAHQLFLRFGAELPKDLPSGIYLIHITAAAGPTSTLKLVILR